MKTLLLTGATGFVGRHVLTTLLDRDYEIHAIFSERKPVIQHAHLHWHALNLHDEKAVQHLMSTLVPKHLLHLAWYAKPKEYWTSPLNIAWMNSSITLLNAFIRTGGERAVFTGSCAEYDWQHKHCHEFSTPCHPKTLYGRSKYALHLLSESLAQAQGVSLAWARLFFLFGAYEYNDRLLPAVIRCGLKRENFNVMNGNQVRDFMYVEDVAQALAALLDSEVTGPVNIASGQPLAIRNLINKIAIKLNSSEWIHYQDHAQNMHEDILTADISRLKHEVKWQPQYSLDAALDKTISWWSTNC